MTLDEIMAKAIEVGDCIEWLGRMGCGGNSGKPIFKRWNGRYSDSVSVCREVWELTRGPIPDGKIVYRLCCNDRCIGCLALGVRGDAMRQRKKLGLAKHTPSTRAALTSGARNRVNVKNTAEQARHARALIADGLLSDTEIKAATGLSSEAIVSDIRRGRAWSESSYASSAFVWRPAA